MSQLFEVLSSPDLDSPVLVVGLEGWIDAGYGAATALTTIGEGVETATIATFDTDVLLDHRARRPTAHLHDGMNTGLTWPVIEVRAATDRHDHDVLFLVGAEPDHLWRAFSKAVTDLALEFGCRLVTGLGAYPAPVPHTRPTRIVATATNRELAELVGFLPGRIDVPSGVAGAIERQSADVGLPAVGLWAQVPHYASAMPYPAAAAALIEALDQAAGLQFGTGDLVDEAAKARTRLDELVGHSPEHMELVHQLEQQVDAADGGAMTEMSGDELAAEFEKFLREQGP
jgi:proteasome assembly chaperone (PAC2) family protein